MAALTPVQRRLAKLRKEQGLRKGQSLVSASKREQKVTRNVTIPDINYGAWSFIDQPPSPEYKSYEFL